MARPQGKAPSAGPGDTVSVKDVADLAGVSVGTVSNVLNRPDSVRPATAERVERAIEALGFVPNGAARQLRAGKSQSVGFVVINVGNPFFTDVAKGVERAAGELGLSVLLANSDESTDRERVYLDLFERQRVLGILVSPLGDDLSRLKAIHRRGMKVVLVDRGADDPRFPSVSVNDHAGGAMAARHLLETGRRRLAFVGGPLNVRQISDRYSGAVAEVNAVKKATIQYFETAGLTLEEGQRVGAVLRERVAAGELDAVFAANDLVAIGVQQALLNGHGTIEIPRDVALVGYDDISFAGAAVVPITSIRQPRDEIGATALRLLVDAPAEGEARHVVFEPELVVRGSSVEPVLAED